jgi:hypothetical protein
MNNILILLAAFCAGWFVYSGVSFYYKKEVMEAIYYMCLSIFFLLIAVLLRIEDDK